ncbi:tol-Pal system protein TolA-like [Melanerpes formicivorus]|uniref:tol-Pal system protein TolA-like n=1 Tax=Melanerpes formicivorus TaxID=211600 RepID=UPI00358E26D1
MQGLLFPGTKCLALGRGRGLLANISVSLSPGQCKLEESLCQGCCWGISGACLTLLSCRRLVQHSCILPPDSVSPMEEQRKHLLDSGCSGKPLSQEQLLRQQVLEKEKELLELRQKLSELEQAQAQAQGKPKPEREKPARGKDAAPQERESRKVSEVSKQQARLKRHLEDKAEGEEKEGKKRRSCREKEAKAEAETCRGRAAGSRGKGLSGAGHKNSQEGLEVSLLLQQLLKLESCLR